MTFPENCPIEPLGIRWLDEPRCYYRLADGQLVGLATARHGKNNLIALFGGHTDWLEEQFPWWVGTEIAGFDQAEASRALIAECAARGAFNLADVTP